MQLKTVFELARISNLPTVWTNVMAAMVLSQHDSSVLNIALVILSMSLVYVGGMFMNDAVDAEWDRRHGVLRPIVCGEAQSQTVFVMAALCFIFSMLLLYFLQMSTREDRGLALVSCLILIGIAGLYNWIHKRSGYASTLMGLCRGMIYITTALALGDVSLLVVIAALSLAAYITGLTVLARHEHLGCAGGMDLNLAGALVLLNAPVMMGWAVSENAILSTAAAIFLSLLIFWKIKNNFFSSRKSVKVGVGALLAMIPLLDAMFLVGAGAIYPALFCVVVFLLVPALHRRVAGT